jgi:hypothetical protein
MAFNGIPAFSIHSSEMTVREGLKLLSQHEFAVIVFAASGILAHSRSAAQAPVTAVIEWSKKGKKDDLAPGLWQPQTALIQRLTERTARWVDFEVFWPASD